MERGDAGGGVGDMECLGLLVAILLINSYFAEHLWRDGTAALHFLRPAAIDSVQGT